MNHPDSWPYGLISPIASPCRRYSKESGNVAVRICRRLRFVTLPQVIQRICGGLPNLNPTREQETRRSPTS